MCAILNHSKVLTYLIYIHAYVIHVKHLPLKHSSRFGEILGNENVTTMRILKRCSQHLAGQQYTKSRFSCVCSKYII